MRLFEIECKAYTHACTFKLCWLKFINTKHYFHVRKFPSIFLVCVHSFSGSTTGKIVQSKLNVQQSENIFNLNWCKWARRTKTERDRVIWDISTERRDIIFNECNLNLTESNNNVGIINNAPFPRLPSKCCATVCDRVCVCVQAPTYIFCSCLIVFLLISIAIMNRHYQRMVEYRTLERSVSQYVCVCKSVFYCFCSSYYEKIMSTNP